MQPVLTTENLRPRTFTATEIKNFARTQIDFLSTIFATETDLAFTPPEDHSGNRITFLIRFSILRTTDSTSKTVPQVLYTSGIGNLLGLVIESGIVRFTG